MLLHSFVRFCVVRQFVLPMLDDLKLPTIHFDSTWKYLNSGNGKTQYPENYIPKS